MRLDRRQIGWTRHREEILLMEIAVPRTRYRQAPAKLVGDETATFIEHKTEQQLINRYKDADGAMHFVALNGEHGKAVDRGEGHEQPDQLQLLYYVDEISYLLDSGYDRAGTVENSSWNHYYDHNVMTVARGEGGLRPPMLRILQVRKASEPWFMGETHELYVRDHRKVQVLHGVQQLRAEPKFVYKPTYTRDVLVIAGDSPYLIDLNQIQHPQTPRRCEWNQFAMHYHANSNDLDLPATYRPFEQGFLRWHGIQDDPNRSLLAFPVSIEFALQPDHFEVVADEVLETEVDQVKIETPIERLTIANRDRCETSWSLATIFQTAPSSENPTVPAALWPYRAAMNAQGWVWARNANAYDVFVARAVAHPGSALDFMLSDADASYPELSLRLPADARFGFARVVSTARGWEIDTNYQVALEQHGGVARTVPQSSKRSIKPDHIPATYKLEEAYPNPFNPTTHIRFGVPETAFVTLKVYDMLGREVRTLIEDTQNAGFHEVVFDAAGLPSGAYLYRLATPQKTVTRRMMLLK